jgi:hypothetical protein
MSEIVFFEHQGVRVTDARAIIGVTTYPIANITAVSNALIPPKRFGAGWAIGVGGFVVLAGILADPLNFRLLVIGLISLAIGVLLWVKAKKLYVVRLHTSGVQQDAMVSDDFPLIMKITDALNDAIVSRSAHR